jgi:hypothetical protein
MAHTSHPQFCPCLQVTLSTPFLFKKKMKKSKPKPMTFVSFFFVTLVLLALFDYLFLNVVRTSTLLG